jgi:hypothetical protein
MNRRTWIALPLVGAAALAYFLLRPSDEERIRWQLAALGRAVVIDPAEKDPRARPLRVHEAFQKILEPSVRVEIPGVVEDVRDRDELTGMAVAVGDTLTDLTVDLRAVRVKVEPGARAARVQASATFAGAVRGGRGDRLVREVTVRFEKVDGEWRIASIAADVDEQASP